MNNLKVYTKGQAFSGRLYEKFDDTELYFSLFRFYGFSVQNRFRENIILSEISQTQELKGQLFSLICVS